VFSGGVFDKDFLWSFFCLKRKDANLKFRAVRVCSFEKKTAHTRAFHFYLEAMEMLSVFVFAAKRMVKGAATLTSFALKWKALAKTSVKGSC